MMDKIDEKILNILEQDGRISMRNLAKQIPMSTPAVSERVRRLEEAGIIEGYTVRINYKKIGKPIRAYVAVTLGNRPPDDFAKSLKCDPRIRKVDGLSGQPALMLQVECRDLEELSDLVDSIKDVAITDTHIVMRPY